MPTLHGGIIKPIYIQNWSFLPIIPPLFCGFKNCYYHACYSTNSNIKSFTVLNYVPEFLSNHRDKKKRAYTGITEKLEGKKCLKFELPDISKLLPLIIAYVEANDHGPYLQESMVQVIRFLKNLSWPSQHSGAAAGH